MVLGFVWRRFERCVGEHAHHSTLPSKQRPWILKFAVRSEMNSVTDRTEGDEGQNLRNYAHNTHTPSFGLKSHCNHVLELKNDVSHYIENWGALFVCPPPVGSVNVHEIHTLKGTAAQTVTLVY